MDNTCSQPGQALRKLVSGVSPGALSACTAGGWCRLLNAMQGQVLLSNWIFRPVRRVADWLTLHASREAERRQATRRMIPRLVAYYWEGTTASHHVVRDVSTSGAFVFAAFKWPPGTIMTVTLQQVAAQGAPTTLQVRTRVVRDSPNGLALQFLYRSKAERHQLADFMRNIIPGDQPGCHSEQVGVLCPRILV